MYWSSYPLGTNWDSAVVNHWATSSQMSVNCRSTVGQPLVNCRSTVSQPLANCWPTVGQPEHHSWPPGHSVSSQSPYGQQDRPPGPPLQTSIPAALTLTYTDTYSCSSPSSGHVLNLTSFALLSLCPPAAATQTPSTHFQLSTGSGAVGAQSEVKYLEG